MDLGSYRLVVVNMSPTGKTRALPSKGIIWRTFQTQISHLCNIRNMSSVSKLTADRHQRILLDLASKPGNGQFQLRSL